MILKIAGIESSIDFKQNINVLEISNKGLYRSIILQLNNAINNKTETTEVMLVENEEQVEMNKFLKIIIDPFNIEFNSKDVLTKVYAHLEKLNLLEIATNPKFEQTIQELLNYVRDLVLDLSFDCTLNDTINFKDLLKVLSVKIDVEQYETLEDKIIFLVDLMSEFNLCNVLIFIGLKQYFNDEQLEMIYRYAISKDMHLLLIDNSTYKKIDLETKIVIDEDFEDFIQ